MKTKIKMRHEQGFSLAELMVAGVITAILVLAGNKLFSFFVASKQIVNNQLETSTEIGRVLESIKRDFNEDHSASHEVISSLGSFKFGSVTYSVECEAYSSKRFSAIEVKPISGMTCPSACASGQRPFINKTKTTTTRYPNSSSNKEILGIYFCVQDSNPTHVSQNYPNTTAEYRYNVSVVAAWDPGSFAKTPTYEVTSAFLYFSEDEAKIGR